VKRLSKARKYRFKYSYTKIRFKFRHLVSGLPKELDSYNKELYYLLTKKEYLEMAK